MEQKPISINVDAKDGQAKVILGNEMIPLVDKTATTFKTTALPHFIAYLIAQDSPKIFYGVDSLSAYKSLDAKFTDTLPIATCDIKKTNIIKFLIDSNNQKMNLEQFEEFLRTTRSFLRGSDTTKLLDILDNLNICKVKTIKRQKDNSGNYSYAFSSDKGMNDYEFPKQISFKVPVIRELTNELELTFDFFFSYSDAHDSPILKFQIRSIDLNEIVDEFIKGAIETALLESALWCKFGSFTVTPQTDKWNHERNDLIIKQQ